MRKLEFLLAEAVERGHDCIITIGGIQSNHARATAVAARYLGLPCHLILRNSKTLADSGAVAATMYYTVLSSRADHEQEACIVTADDGTERLLAGWWLQTREWWATCLWSG